MKKNYKNMRSKNNATMDIILISNANTDVFDNTRTQFTNSMPRESIEPGRWEVGIDYFHMDNFFVHNPDDLYTQEYSMVYYDILTRRILAAIKIKGDDNITSNEQFLQVIKKKFSLLPIEPGFVRPDYMHMSFGDTHAVWHTVAVAKNTAIAMDPLLIKRLRLTTEQMQPVRMIRHGTGPYDGFGFFVPMRPVIDVANNVYDEEERTWPALINIVLEGIKANISSGGYSKIVKSIPFNFVDRTKFAISRTFEKGEYFALESEIPQYFKVTLTDENDRRLNLASGQPTVLAINLRKTMQKSFVISVNSGNNPEEFPSNTSSQFRTSLPHSISLNDGWEVALSSIRFSNHINYGAKVDTSYWMGIYYLAPTPNRVEADPSPDLLEMKINFDKLGNCFTPAEIFERMTLHGNLRIAETAHKLKIKFDYDVEANEVRLSIFDTEDTDIKDLPLFEAFIIMSESLSHLLGDETVKSDDGSYTAEYSRKGLSDKGGKLFLGHLHASALIPQTLLVYTNITNPIIIGGSYGKIVKVLPIKPPKNKANPLDTILYESKTLSFITAANSEVYTIDVRILDIGGQYVDFYSDSSTSVNFIVRKKEK